MPWSYFGILQFCQRLFLHGKVSRHALVWPLSRDLRRQRAFEQPIAQGKMQSRDLDHEGLQKQDPHWRSTADLCIVLALSISQLQAATRSTRLLQHRTSHKWDLHIMALCCRKLGADYADQSDSVKSEPTNYLVRIAKPPLISP